MVSNINILHLSDLHFSRQNNAFDQGVILDALKRDLKIKCSGQNKPDIVIFSGDLVNAADDDENYFRLYDQLLDNLTPILGITDERIFLCPGNHDLHRDVVERNAKDQHALQSISTRAELNNAYNDDRFCEFVEKKFSSFNEFSSYFVKSGTKINNGFVRVDFIAELNVDIITVNTAWASNGGLKEAFGEDERNLLVAEASLYEAAAQLTDGSYRILVTHHPLHWLKEFCEIDFEAVMGGKVHMHLFGHMHVMQPKKIVAPSGEYISQQGGALYQGRERYNGYSLISVVAEAKHIRIIAQSYFDQRRMFDTGVDVLDNGVFYSSEAAYKFWTANAFKIDQDILKAWIGDVLTPAALDSFGEGIVEKSLHDVFVAPPMFRKDSPKPETGNEIPEQAQVETTIDELAESHANLVVYGKQEYGKTTLLQQLSVRLLERCIGRDEQPMVPVIVNFRSIRPGARPVTGPIDAALLVEPPVCGVPALLENGFMTILVDDVEFSDSRRMGLLREFMGRYPRNRFIFSTMSSASDEIYSALGGDVVVDTHTPLYFQHIFLKPFNRKKFRRLVKRWDCDGALDQEQILNRLLSEMSGMNIPFTAVNGTILLSIWEQKDEFRPVNRSTLIEQFVEHALEKRSRLDAFRASFDFRNKEFVLSELAALMAKSNEYILTEEQVAEALKQILNRIGIAESPDKILISFIGARILKRSTDGLVSFRYRAFLEYFIASKMRDDEEFRSWILDEERYLSFLHEILYYAGMSRNDLRLLTMVGDRFEVLDKQAEIESGWNPDLMQVEKFVPPADDSDTDVFSAFERQMESPPYSEERRDEILNSDLPVDAEERQEVFRPAPKDIGQRWTIALFLYSGILKNLEHLDDVQKRTHLRKLLRAWSGLTAQTLSLVPLIAHHRGAKINGVAYIVQMPKHFSDSRVARFIYLELPKSVSQLMFINLGTEKLARQLLEPELIDSEEPLIVKFHRTSLIMLLQLPHWVRIVEKFGDELSGVSRYLSEALMRSISESYQLGGHKKEVSTSLLTFLGRTIATLKGGSRAEQTKQSVRVVEHSKRRELVKRLKMQSQQDEDY